MKEIVIAGLVAFSGAAWAASGPEDATQAMPAMVLAQAGHGEGMAGHAMAGGHALASAKVSSTLTVSGCWIRSLPVPAPSGGYFVVKNSGGKQASLQSISSASYGMIMLHQTTQKDGMSRMSGAQDIGIPAGGRLEFKPGGYHAMLEDPVKVPAVGSKVAMDFLFDNGEKASAECEVKAANAKAPMSH